MTEKTAVVHWEGQGKKGQGKISTETGALKNYPYRFASHFEDEQSALYMMFNAGGDAIDFALPPVAQGTRWHQAVDTSRVAPKDLFAAGEEPLCKHPQTYQLSPRASAILLVRYTALPEAL